MVYGIGSGPQQGVAPIKDMDLDLDMDIGWRRRTQRAVRILMPSMWWQHNMGKQSGIGIALDRLVCLGLVVYAGVIFIANK